MEAKDSSAPPPLAALPLLANHSAAAESKPGAADPPRAAAPPPPPPPPPSLPSPRDALEERAKNPSSSSPPMAPPPVMMVIQSQQQHSLNGSPATTPPPGSGGGGGGSVASALSLGGGGGGSGGGGGGLSGGGGGSGPLLKRKRGRPRKYVEGTSPPVLIMGSGSPAPVVSGISAISGLPTPPSSLGMALALAPLAAASSAAAAQLPFAAAASTAAAPPASAEKKRGRPPGTGKKQQLAALGAWLAGSAGQGFTPHVITIAAGEDVATRIISFAQIGPRATCVLSANGAISNVTLRQPATSGGTVTYEGRFEILSLSGSFLLTEIGNTRSRTGGLSVSLAGPDGRVIGGSVAGLLIAASPVQVVVGSFLAESRKPAPQVQVRPNSGSTSEMISGMATAVNSPLSTTRPVLHGSNPINGNNNTSNDNTNANTNNNNNNSSNNDANNNNDSPVHHHHHHHHHHLGWSGGQDDHQNQSAGHGTDINISLPGS